MTKISKKLVRENPTVPLYTVPNGSFFVIESTVGCGSSIGFVPHAVELGDNWKYDPDDNMDTMEVDTVISVCMIDTWDNGGGMQVSLLPGEQPVKIISEISFSYKV